MFEETNLDLCLCLYLCTGLFILKYFIFKSSFPYTKYSTNLLKNFIKYFFIRKNESIKKYIDYHFKIDVYITTDDIPLIFSRIKSITSNIQL